jgi:hypothetical protein
VRRLEADDAAAGGRDANRARAVSSERRVAEAGDERGGRAAARPARDPPLVERIDDVAEVRVLRRDPVCELMQVRLPDDGVARVLEPRDRLGRPLRNMLAEDRRPEGRGQPGGVEEILDAEADSIARRLRNGEEGVVDVFSRRRRCRSRR